MIDDEDDGDGDMPTRSTTPKPAVPEKDPKAVKVVREGSANGDGDKKAAKEEKNGQKPTQETSGLGEKTKDNANTNAPGELPPHIKAKLRKLEKLESTYPGTDANSHLSW